MSGMVGITDLDAATCVPIKRLPGSCVTLFELRLIPLRSLTTTFVAGCTFLPSTSAEHHLGVPPPAAQLLD
jgi:hypothetical protein